MTPSQPPRTSIPSTVPKRSSGGPYIAAIVVLVLLIVGLVWFKFSREKPPPPLPIVQSVTTVTTPPPPIFDIPAPPEIEAGPDAEPDTTKKVVAGGPNLCSGPCDGNAPPALRSALSGTAASARGCYERALRTNSTLEGRMVVAVRVASNGNVCSASVVQDTVGSPQVSACVVGLFSGKRFPPVTGGRCADVQVPLSFKPRENK